MSLRSGLLVLGISGCVVLMASTGFLRAEADKPMTEAQKGVEAAIQAYNQALAKKDLAACMECFVPGPDAFVMGTGPGESWRGPAEIREAHVNFFKAFDKETSEPIWRNIMVSGDVAWVASQSRLVDVRKGEKHEFFLNVSGVFKKIDGKWKIALLHISNVTGPDLKSK